MSEKRYTKTRLGIEGYADDYPAILAYIDALWQWIWIRPRNLIQIAIIEYRADGRKSPWRKN